MSLSRRRPVEVVVLCEQYAVGPENDAGSLEEFLAVLHWLREDRLSEAACS